MTGAVVVVDLQLPMQSVPITTNVVSLNPLHARCTQYNIVIISDLWHVGDFLQVDTPVSSTSKTDRDDIT